MSSVHAIDISNYTQDFDANWVQKCRDEFNNRMFIVQGIPDIPGFPRSKTDEQISIIRQVSGVYIVGYVYPFFSPNFRVAPRLATFDRHRDVLAGMYVDLEDTTGQYRESQVDGWLAECDQYINEKSGIYSGGWFFDDAKWNNVALWNDRSLWDSFYDGRDDNVTEAPGYGGWDSRDIKQYMGSTSLYGITGIDINVLHPAYWNALEGNPGKVAITIGDGMKNRMAENGDHFLADHYYDHQTMDDGSLYTIEFAYGTKGRYISSNYIGGGNHEDRNLDQWENAGPF